MRKNNNSARFKAYTKQQKLIDANNRVEFTKVTEKLVSIAADNALDYNSPSVQEVFIKLNILWKNYSRKLINSNKSHYDTQNKRINLIYAFEQFYEKLKKG